MLHNSTPIDMGHNVWMIDLFEQNQPYRTAAYLILDEKRTLIETGSGASHDTLVAAMAKLCVSPADLDYVIVTHVHLDHAGGAGHMMEKAHKAQLIVHPRGARHMIDPSRLWNGAGEVYGERLVELFDSVVPVAQERVVVKSHGDTLNIGERTLTFYDSPGHAKHHFTLLDPISNALFAGDAVGIRYRTELTHWDFEFVMPSSSPVDFDPVAVHNTMEMLRPLPFEWVYHAHFGKSPKKEAMFHTERVANGFARCIQEVYRPDIEVVEVIAALRAWINQDLKEQGFQPGPIEALDVDILLDSLGLMYFEGRRRAQKA